MPIPESLRCGICGDVFSDPVSACDGMAYDRHCIEAWFANGHKVSPVSRQEMETTEVRPNRALQAAVDDYLRLREKAEREKKQWVEFVGEMQGRMARKLMHKKQQVSELKSALNASGRSPSLSRQPSGSLGGMRRSATANGDLSAAAEVAERQQGGGAAIPRSSFSSGAIGPPMHSFTSTGSGVSSLGLEGHHMEPNEDRSHCDGIQAFAAGPAPRHTRSMAMASEGDRHIGLLGRLKAGAWKGSPKPNRMAV